MGQKIITIIWLFLIIINNSFAQSENHLYDNMELKPRVVVLTDIAPNNIEPDDMESMIRLMAHADLFEIEAIIATSGWNSGRKKHPVEWSNIIHIVIDNYEKDIRNLMRRSGQTKFMTDEECPQKIGYWPSADYLHSRVMVGSLFVGQKHIGEDNRSDASDYIIKLTEENDNRPLWIISWGGANTLAQAIWQVEQERSPSELKHFLNKLRVYTITDQDVPYWAYRNHRYSYSSHKYMREKFADELLFIWDESAYISQNYIGANNWVDYAAHIQGHGHLGAIYPKYKYGVEGDTPSFLHIIPNGLNNPSIPDMVGWGGYFRRQITKDEHSVCYTNHQGDVNKISQHYEQYFYPAIFNNFAARMDWAQNGLGNRNPIVIVDDCGGLEIINKRVKVGDSVTLNAEKTFDPDGDKLNYRWWRISEAGDYLGNITIENHLSSTATIVIPKDAQQSSIHIICEVQDDGVPALTSYRRIILNII